MKSEFQGEQKKEENIMTRRVLAYEDRGKYYISQEFNGDRREGLQWNKNTLLKANWEDIIPLFDDIKTLTKFRRTVKKAEELYGYETYPLRVDDELPRCEEVWKVTKGKLVLYAKYDEVVYME